MFAVHPLVPKLLRLKEASLPNPRSPLRPQEDGVNGPNRAPDEDDWEVVPDQTLELEVGVEDEWLYIVEDSTSSSSSSTGRPASTKVSSGNKHVCADDSAATTTTDARPLPPSHPDSVSHVEDGRDNNKPKDNDEQGKRDEKGKNKAKGVCKNHSSSSSKDCKTSAMQKQWKSRSRPEPEPAPTATTSASASTAVAKTPSLPAPLTAYTPQELHEIFRCRLHRHRQQRQQQQQQQHLSNNTGYLRSLSENPAADKLVVTSAGIVLAPDPSPPAVTSTPTKAKDYIPPLRLDEHARGHCRRMIDQDPSSVRQQKG